MTWMNIDYAYYTETFGGGDVPEDSFTKYLTRAAAVFKRITFNHIVCVEDTYGQYLYGKEHLFRALTDDELEACRLAICNLMDKMYVLDQLEAQALAGASSDGNITSRSSGGESISYGTVSTAYTAALTSQKAKMELFRNAMIEFMDPTAFEYNPFYAGVWR